MIFSRNDAGSERTFPVIITEQAGDSGDVSGSGEGEGEGRGLVSFGDSVAVGEVVGEDTTVSVESVNGCTEARLNKLISRTTVAKPPPIPSQSRSFLEGLETVGSGFKKLLRFDDNWTPEVGGVSGSSGVCIYHSGIESGFMECRSG